MKKLFDTLLKYPFATWRKYALFCIGFFLIVTSFTALVIIPSIEAHTTSHHRQALKSALDVEVASFRLFIDDHQTLLLDFSHFPSIQNALLTPNGNKENLKYLFANETIEGSKGRLVLQDRAGNILIQTTTALKGSYAKTDLWQTKLLKQEIPYFFKLLGQDDTTFSFQLSVPIIINTRVSGILSAEITVLKSHAFVAPTLNNKVAISLKQNNITVNTNVEKIILPHETTRNLTNPPLTMTYISDDAHYQASTAKLRNTILLLLLASLAISFVLFSVFEYLFRVNQHQPLTKHSLPRNVYFFPILLWLIGVTATITAYIKIDFNQTRYQQSQLQTESKEMIEAIRDSIQTSVSTLDTLKAFYSASSFVSRRDFTTFTKPLLKNNPNIQALAWVPVVSKTNRLEYEKNAHNDGLNDFTFKDQHANGVLVKSPPQSLYYPIYYIEPLIHNALGLGLSPSSIPTWHETITQAIDTGQHVATAPLSIRLNNQPGSYYCIFKPIYDSDVDLSNRLDRRKHILGLVLLILESDSVIKEALSNHFHQRHLLLEDVSNPNQALVITGKALAKNTQSFIETIPFANRTWKITTQNAANQPLDLFVWFIVLTGIAFSTLVSLGLLSLIKRRELLKSMVKDRTQDLSLLSKTIANANDIFMIVEKPIAQHDLNALKIIYVNESFTRYFGYQAKEVLGKSPYLIEDDDFDLKEQLKIQNAIHKGIPYAGEIMIYTKSMKQFWMNIHISPIKNDNGLMTHFAYVMHDITERKAAEQERNMLIERLTDSNQELARFAYICSHDLQEPLRMISSFSEKLQEHLCDAFSQDEKGKKYFHFITEGARNAQMLITDILDYASIDTNTQTLAPVDLHHLVQDISDKIRATRANDDINIAVDALPTILGHKTQLYQLFQNLINNAIKYQAPNSKAEVFIRCQSVDGNWQFSIQDNGIGMEQKHLHKIFDIFQRLHRKSIYPGTGIGLAICKKVVQRHGGKIWVESTINVGSTFFFTLANPNG